MIALEPLAPPSPSPDFTPWFTREVLPHESHLRHYLRTRFPAISDPDDVIQEAYLRLFRIHQRGTPMRSSKAFLFTLARNLTLDLIRRSQRSPLIESTLDHVLRIPADQPDAAELAARHQEHHLLRQAIDTLPTRTPTALAQHPKRRFTCAATPPHKGLPPDTVHPPISRALRHCTEYFQENGFMHTSTSTRKSA